MIEPTLLASAPSLTDILEAVRRFYAGTPKALIPTSGTTWKITSPSGVEVTGIRVRLLRKRYRLEMTHG